MKIYAMVLLALTAACTTPGDFSNDDLMPFTTSMAPDGTRSWRFVLTPLVRDYWHSKSGEQLLAETMAAHDYCQAGYVVDQVDELDGVTVYSGRCR